MKRSSLLILLVGAFAALIPLFLKNKEDKPLKEAIERGLQRAEKQALVMADSLKNREGRLPKTFSNGRLQTCSCYDWVSGFYPGVLWYLYEENGNEEWKALADKFTSRLKAVQHVTTNHDVGFMLYCSYGNGFRLTGRDDYRQVLLTGAKSLSTRYNPLIKSLRSWDLTRNGLWQFPVIIDNMMNLELLMFAAKESGDSRFSEIAEEHARTTMKNHYRDDFSSYHVVSYDTISGLPHLKMTHQGYSDESSWARGQSWGLYGYVMMFRETGNEVYLRQAKHIADYLMRHPNMPSDKIPYWDYNVPDIPDTYRDVSAAAIMASALIELSSLDESPAASSYLDFAREQLITLSSDEYLAEEGSNGGFILKHGVGFLPGNSEIDVPLSYADYYYVEALVRMNRLLVK